MDPFATAVYRRPRVRSVNLLDWVVPRVQPFVWRRSCQPVDRRFRRWLSPRSPPPTDGGRFRSVTRSHLQVARYRSHPSTPRRSKCSIVVTILRPRTRTRIRRNNRSRSFAGVFDLVGVAHGSGVRLQDQFDHVTVFVLPEMTERFCMGAPVPRHARSHRQAKSLNVLRGQAASRSNRRRPARQHGSWRQESYPGRDGVVSGRNPRWMSRTQLRLPNLLIPNRI